MQYLDQTAPPPNTPTQPCEENREAENWLDVIPFGICRFDDDDRLLVFNRLVYELYGLGPSDLFAGITIGEVLTQIEDDRIRRAVEDAIAQRRPTTPDAITWETSQGRSIAVTCQIVKEGGYVVIHEDTTAAIAKHQELVNLAHLDGLTGLLNRRAFTSAIADRFSELVEGQEVAALYIDLDHFKPINDMYGHPVGDEILRQVADRIQLLAGHDDFVARVGGDEFVILQVEGPQPSHSRELASELIEQLARPFQVGDQFLHIGASVGVAIAPYDACTPENLIKNADLALYGAKSNGRGVLRYFEPEMESRMECRRTLETELRIAIDAEQFEVHYQPLLDLEANRIVSFEALIRWQHPTMGPMRPDQFIALAEETGLIVPLGTWILKTACTEAAKWPDDISLAVNISPIQLRNRCLFTNVHDALTQSGLPPERLELEITENALLSDVDLTITMLHRIRSLGVRVAMDDFGTGYSSINYLRRFPFDKIKIDRTFVSDSDTKSESMALVKMIAALGCSLGIKTTAEGVETSGELEFVRAAGCSEVQGFLLSKPITAALVEELLSQASNQTGGDQQGGVDHV